MHRMCSLIGALAVGVTCTQPVEAGLPLKGVDVKLGRNPGGNCASRTADDHGNVDFGVWPRGNYTVSIAPATKATNVHVTVRGATGGVIERNLAGTAARATPIAFAVDGRQPIRVSIELPSASTPQNAARVRSHSNSTNN